MKIEIRIEVVSANVVRASIATLDISCEGSFIHEVLSDLGELIEKGVYTKVRSGELELTNDIRALLGLNGKNMSNEEWLKEMELGQLRDLFDAAIAKHYPSLVLKFGNKLPYVCWDGVSDDTPDNDPRRWLSENETKARWDLVKNGPTGEIWCKFIYLLAPLAFDPASAWEDWESAGLPLPPKPTNLPQIKKVDFTAYQNSRKNAKSLTQSLN